MTVGGWNPAHKLTDVAPLEGLPEGGTGGGWRNLTESLRELLWIMYSGQTSQHQQVTQHTVSVGTVVYCGLWTNKPTPPGYTESLRELLYIMDSEQTSQHHQVTQSLCGNCCISWTLNKQANTTRLHRVSAGTVVYHGLWTNKPTPPGYTESLRELLYIMDFEQTSQHHQVTQSLCGNCCISWTLNKQANTTRLHRVSAGTVVYHGLWTNKPTPPGYTESQRELLWITYSEWRRQHHQVTN